MIRISRIALSLALISAMAGSLVACSKPAPEATTQAGQAAATDGVKSVDPADQALKNPLALVDACNIELLDPNSVEWDTHWDPAYSRDASKHPSGVRSAHWAEEEDLADLKEAGQAYPLELSCGSDGGSEYSILIEMLAPGSSLEDIPMQSGSYPIVATAGGPGQFVVRNLQFNGASFQASGGNVSIERFNSEGASGNFVIEGREAGGENRPIRIEGTFNMPCRYGQNQTACQSDKAERESR